MLAVRPVTVTEFAVEAATFVSVPPPTRTTSYPATPTLSLDAVQVRFAEVAVTAEAVGAPGAVGAWVSLEPPPKTVASLAVCAMPLAPLKMRLPHEVICAGSKLSTRSRIGSVLPLQDQAR